MERVLVTGSAGFVGCALVPHLLREGYAVRALDRFRHAHPGLLHLAGDPNLEIVKGDVRDAPTMREALKGVDWIIPLAAVVGAPACDANPFDAVSINVGAISCLLAERGKDQRIICVNTNSGYGTTPPGEVCTEETPLRPVSLYGRTKVEAEWTVMDKGNAVAFRLATAFGVSSRMRLDLLVNDFVWRAVRDKAVVLYEPHFRRNYIHVNDVARAFVHAMRNWSAMGDKVYNVGELNCTKRLLCEMIGFEVPGFRYFESDHARDVDQRDYQVSTARMAAMGFHSTVGINPGIKELVKAYRMMPVGGFANA